MDQHDAFFKKCKQLITERAIDYSAPDVNIGRISMAWSQYLDLPISKYDVCVLMAMLKLSRLCNGHHEDSLHDAAAYLALAHSLARSGVDHD